MPIRPSTRLEIEECEALVARIEAEIASLIAAGKKVHVIWDGDHVLFSGRSDDVVNMLGFKNLHLYFQYEERLILQPLEEGPWIGLARTCAEQGVSQDLVTARSSLLGQRVMFFLISTGIIRSFRWELLIGHQSKEGSYGIILDSFRKDPDAVVFCVDDVQKHCDAFAAAAEKLDMRDRARPVLAPQIRRWHEPELRDEIAAVLGATGTRPIQHHVMRAPAFKTGRTIRIAPDPVAAIQEALGIAVTTVDTRARSDHYRPELRKFLEDFGREIPEGDEEILSMIHDIAVK